MHNRKNTLQPSQMPSYTRRSATKTRQIQKIQSCTEKNHPNTTCILVTQVREWVHKETCTQKTLHNCSNKEKNSNVTCIVVTQLRGFVKRSMSTKTCTQKLFKIVQTVIEIHVHRGPRFQWKQDSSVGVQYSSLKVIWHKRLVICTHVHVQYHQLYRWCNVNKNKQSQVFW